VFVGCSRLSIGVGVAIGLILTLSMTRLDPVTALRDH
jgi:ABC-type antimicrobial peptide transport system permease subunit